MIASAGCADRRLERELKVATPIGRGRSTGARRVQELLVANGIRLVVDGDFGDATATGIGRFCVSQGIPPAATVNQALMDRLAQPLLRAVDPVAPLANLGDTVVAIARQHLKEHPIEIGKPNSGPWVRLYMNGSEGPDFPWCAGFVTYIVKTAAKAHGKVTPITYTFSCDSLGMEARHNGKFVRRAPSATAAAGSVFLVPHASNTNDWIHTGIITGGDRTVFDTIEGNTNDSGSREGFEVCDRIRACARVDIVTL